MSAIRVVFADDHALVRGGLRHLLAAVPEVEVVGEAGDGVEALEVVKATRPDVVILDVSMPRMGGLEAIRPLREASPDTRIVVLSVYSAEAFVHEALRSGASGYVLKADAAEDLVAAVRAVHAGRHYLSPAISGDVIRGYIRGAPPREEAAAYAGLSDRERQVFLLMVAGNTTAEIAEILFISPKTVEKHRAAVTAKLGFGSHTEMIKIAIRAGLLDPDFWKA